MPPASSVAPAAGQFDPAALDPVALAAELIRFDTSHNGEGADTRPLAEFVAEILNRAGVTSEIVATPTAGNVHLVARVPGAGHAAPLLLLAHSDVVSADARRWHSPPFEPVRRDGALWGRGSLDMKGTLSAMITALMRHVTAGATFDRDIVLVSDADEEGGWYGTPWLLRERPDLVGDAGAVLTEGGWTLANADAGNPLIASITCADRTFVAVRLTATATATHSSRPLADSAVAQLATVVTKVAALRVPVVLTELSRGYFAALGEALPDGPWRAAVREMLAAEPGPDLDAAADAVLADSAYPALHNAMLRATIAFVRQDGGLRANVVPAEASVLLQIRVTPLGQPVDELLDLLRGAVGDSAELTLVGPPGEPAAETIARWRRDQATIHAPVDHEVVRAWQGAVAETWPGVPAVPAMFEGGTSGKPWAERGIPVYGIYPYPVDLAALTAMHGDDEHVGEQELRDGTDLLTRMLDRLRAR